MASLRIVDLWIWVMRVEGDPPLSLKIWRHLYAFEDCDASRNGLLDTFPSRRYVSLLGHCALRV